MELSGSLPDPHGPPSMYGILLNKKMRCAIHMKSSVDEIRNGLIKTLNVFPIWRRDRRRRWMRPWLWNL